MIGRDLGPYFADEKTEIHRGDLAKSPKLEGRPSESKFSVLSTKPCGRVLGFIDYPPENGLGCR